MNGDAVNKARLMVGVPFRPQGRDAAVGLDCVGLTIETYGIDASQVRADYRLRGAYRAEIERVLNRFFRRVARKSARAGDLLLYLAGPDQFHLAVKTELGVIHADAGLRKVVERPGIAPWPLIAVFRRRVHQLKAG